MKEKEPKKSYKKPQIVAKSDAKKSYVAGCPTRTFGAESCCTQHTDCHCGHLN